MNNIWKIIACGIIFLLIGLGAKMGASAMPEKNNNLLTANMFEAVSFAENLSVQNASEIPGRKEVKVPETLSVKASIVVDLDLREKVFSLHEADYWPLASITKLMSAIVARENMDPKQRVELSPSAIGARGVAGRFSVGETYLVEDLIRAMIVVSSNDAAVALSENMPEGRFVSLMNQKAQALGMDNTRFHEPTGLSILNQGTANDLALFIEYAWDKHPELFSMSSRNAVVIRELNTNTNVRLMNINALAARNDFLGGKTGYTEDANQNLVSVFSIQGKPTAIIILGADDRIKEAEKIITFVKNDINASY